MWHLSFLLHFRATLAAGLWLWLRSIQLQIPLRIMSKPWIWLWGANSKRLSAIPFVMEDAFAEWLSVIENLLIRYVEGPCMHAWTHPSFHLIVCSFSVIIFLNPDNDLLLICDVDFLYNSRCPINHQLRWWEPNS